MSAITAAIRKSGRLSTKTAISYKEKKIPKISKPRISKKVVVQKDQKTSKATKVNNKKGKTERVKAEKVQVEKIKIIEYSNSPSASFDLSEGSHLKDAVNHFKKHDPKLAAYLDEETLAKFRNKLSRTSGVNAFRSLASAIIYQQIHGKAAAAIEAKFINLFDTQDDDTLDGDWYPSPDDVLGKSIEELRTAGLSARKAEYLQCLAQKFNDRSIIPENFVNMSDDEIAKQLIQVKGVGQWTVDMFLMQDLNHSDILPLSDLAIRKGVAKHFDLAMPTDKKKVFPLPHHMVELTDIWRPYRTVASWLIWRSLDIKVTGS